MGGRSTKESKPSTAGATHVGLLDRIRSLHIEPEQARDTNDVAERDLGPFWERDWAVTAVTNFAERRTEFGRFQTLDLDSLMHIVQFLDRRDVAALARVNKTFMVAVNDPFLWHTLYFREHQGEDERTDAQSDRTRCYREEWKGRVLMKRRWFTNEPVVLSMDAHNDGIGCMYYRDNLLATGAKDDTIRLWRMADGFPFESAVVLSGAGKWVWGVQFDDEVLVSASRDHSVRIWKMQHLLSVRSAGPVVIPPFRKLSGTGAMTALQFDKQKIVSSSNDGSVKIWGVSSPDFASVDLVHNLSAHNSGVFSLAYNDHYMLTGSKDETVKIWDWQTLDCIGSLQGHKLMVRAVKFDQRSAVTGAGDGDIRIWDLRTRNCEQVLKGHDCHVKVLQFDNTKIVSGAKDSTIRLWDMRMPTTHVRHLHGHTGPVYGLQYTDSTLLSCSFDRTIRRWSF